jgi:hypothetical protein
MTTGFFTFTAVALAAALSACAASGASPRVAAAQAPGTQLHIGTSRSAPDCGYDQGNFDTPEAMKLPKQAFECQPQ